jgi:NADH-quinone oxidoreductase subunit C
MAAAPPEPTPEATEGTDAAAAPEPETVFGCPVSYSRGQRVVHPTREGYLDLMKALVDDGYLTCAALTAVDFLTHPGRELPDGITPERFEIVVVLWKLDSPDPLRIRVQVPEHDASIPTLFDIWPGTEALEREVYDMFGITFDDHPDLSRILMPEDWIGHPLRKDYAVGTIPVQYKGAPEAR